MHIVLPGSWKGREVQNIPRTRELVGLRLEGGRVPRVRRFGDIEGVMQGSRGLLLGARGSSSTSRKKHFPTISLNSPSTPPITHARRGKGTKRRHVAQCIAISRRIQDRAYWKMPDHHQHLPGRCRDWVWGKPRRRPSEDAGPRPELHVDTEHPAKKKTVWS